MRLVLLMAFLVGAGSAFACADYYESPIEDIVSSSDIIVRGQLKGVRPFKRGSADWAAGEIVVKEVHWGNVHLDERLVLSWPRSKSPCDYTYDEESNRMAIWCLARSTEDSGGTGAAARAEVRSPTLRETLPVGWRDSRLVQARLWPGHARSVEEKEKIRALIMNNPVCLRSRRFGPKLTDLILEIVYRNPRSTVAFYPGIVQMGNILVLSRGDQLELHEVFPSSVPAKPKQQVAPIVGATSAIPAVPNIAIPPQGEHTITIRIADVFTIKENTPYDASLRLKDRTLTARVILFDSKSFGRR